MSSPLISHRVSRRVSRVAVTAAVLGVAVVIGAGSASAHIDPDPTEAQAGSTLSVGFTVEHGCDGSPTVQLDMRLPDGVTNASPDPIEGWEGAIVDNVITFVGGPLADDVEGTFSVTMTLPPTPDTTVYFPFVQRCEVGEIRWIGIPQEPGDELAEPAPALALTGPAVIPTTPATTSPPPTTPPTPVPATPVPATPVPATTGPEASVPATTEAVTASSVPSTSATNPDEPGSSSTGTIIFIASIAAVIVVGGLAYLRSRRAREAHDAS